MSDPTVSVVMCVHNGARFLQEALDGIFSQTFRDLELIVVDDASTDGTPGILERCSDPRLCILNTGRNLGPYKAANIGLARVRGAYVARHDADDVSDRDRLRKQVAFLNANPDVGLVASDYDLIDQGGRVIDRVMVPTDPAELKARLASGNVFCHGTVMARREIFERMGGYREYFRVSQDYDMIIRASELADLASIPEPLYHFRFHGASLSRNKRSLQLACRQLAWDLAVQRRTTGTEGPVPANVVEAYPPESRKLFLDARGSSYLYFAAGEFGKAAEALMRAREYAREVDQDLLDWDLWALSRALTLSRLRSDVAAGREFLVWFGRCGADLLTSPVSRLLGRYYADQAFAAHAQGGEVVSNFRRSVRHDPRWLKNTGLWLIALSAVLKRRPKPDSSGTRR